MTTTGTSLPDKSVLLVLAMCLAGWCHADLQAQGTLYDLYNNLDILDANSNCPPDECWTSTTLPDVRHAQQFVMGKNTTIDEVSLQLIRTGENVSGSITIELWNDDGIDEPLLPGDPQALVAVIGEIPDVSQIPRVRTDYTFTNPITGLEPNQKYWVVVNYSGLNTPLSTFRSIGLAHTLWPEPGGTDPAAEYLIGTRGAGGTNGAAPAHATKRPYDGWDELARVVYGAQEAYDLMAVKTSESPFHSVPLSVGETYTQDFDEALGIDGQLAGQPFPTGWSYTEDELFFGTSETTMAFPAGTSLGSGTPIYNAGTPDDTDRALALGITRRSFQPMLQLVADVTDSNASSLQLQFDVETWDAARNADLPGEAAFDVVLDVDTGEGFVPLVDLGKVTTGATLLPSATADLVNGNLAGNRVSFDSGPVDAAIPEGAKLRVRWLADTEASTTGWVYGLDNVSLRLFGKDRPPQLLPGDADQDLDFDQLDLVQVQVAAKYLTGQSATWGEGDWNGAPGGSPGNPPAGDGLFNQFDVIAAQQSATYLTGPYATVHAGGRPGDGQTSVIYDPSTGELAVDAPSGTDLTSINIDSAAGIFTGQAAQNLGGSFDNDADGNIFKATFGSSFGSLSFGHVARAGLSEQFVLDDLSVVGSLAGGGDLGDVDLVYVPEPTSAFLFALGLAIGLSRFRRIDG